MAKKDNKTRKLLQKLYGSLYHRMEGADGNVCWYCGDARQCLDHVPPLSVIDSINLDRFRERGGKLLLVPSCTDCNAALGDKRSGTPYERLNWLYAHYAAKAEKIWTLWGDEEIKEMGRGMKSYIKAKQQEAYYWVSKFRKVERRISEMDDDIE